MSVETFSPQIDSDGKNQNLWADFANFAGNDEPTVFLGDDEPTIEIPIIYPIPNQDAIPGLEIPDPNASAREILDGEEPKGDK